MNMKWKMSSIEQKNRSFSICENMKIQQSESQQHYSADLWRKTDFSLINRIRDQTKNAKKHKHFIVQHWA
jgi:hypothetical protein